MCCCLVNAGIRHLVRWLAPDTPDALAMQAAATLGVLSAHTPSRVQVLESGAANALTATLGRDCADVRATATAAIWSLAYEPRAANSFLEAGAVPLLLDCATQRGVGTHEQQHATGALCVLTASAAVCTALTAGGGVPLLLEVLRQHEAKPASTVGYTAGDAVHGKHSYLLL